jgi:hypothetical protein
MKAKRAWRKSTRNVQKSHAYSNKRAEGVELRSSRQYRQPLRSFINAPQQHGLSSLSPLLSPRKYLCGKINEKARAHRPQSVVGSRTGQHATDLELSSFGGSDQPFASQSPACRWPAAALGAAFLPTRPCARTDPPPKPTMPGALSRSCTLP